MPTATSTTTATDTLNLQPPNYGGHPSNVSDAVATVVSLMQAKWPRLSVSSTTDGQHASGSEHYTGDAVDMSSSDFGYMDRAAQWAIDSGVAKQLSQGIHNPNLSYDSGRPVPASFWGSETWANHRNHLHLGVGNGFNLAAIDASVTGGAGGGGAGGGGAPTDVSPQSIASIAKAAALSTFLELPTVLSSAESQALTGERSLMNDMPLLPFIEQLCQASLRNFQSMPNGNFFAFYSDYFGGLNHRTAYWRIEDIEILDGRIQLSDDALATHVYVVGDITPPFGTGVDLIDNISTAGIVNVFNAFLADFLNGVSDPALSITDPGKKAEAQRKFDEQTDALPTLANKENAVTFLKKYGARPYREEAPMVRSPFFEMFLAYQKFCLLWSQQFLTTFEFTFMPELFPGGIVAFEDHGLQCYIEEVVHECNYESGFTTRANLSSPAALKDKAGNTSGRTNLNEGMIRAGAFAATGGSTRGNTPQATSGKPTNG